jgi:pimeloyl-ACP methyl ester carboxylesterase
MNTNLPNAILIHGAWQGSWGWSKVLPIFDRRGWRAQAIDLPGNGVDSTPPEDVTLDLYVDHILKVAETLDGPLAIVAHSGAGVLASQVGEAIPDRVSCLVYIAGMMLPNDTGFSDIIASLTPEHPNAIGIGQHLIWSTDRLTSSIKPQDAIDVFYHDCEPSDARWAAQRLTPQPERGRAVKPKLTVSRYGRIPRIYVEAALDRSVIPEAQRLMQHLSPGARRIVMNTGHAPQLAQPEVLVERLEEAMYELIQQS